MKKNKASITKPVHKSPHYQKFLVLEERITISKSLDNAMKISQIAQLLGRHISTITMEIKRYACQDSPQVGTHPCSLQPHCRLNHVCGDQDCNRPCSLCKIVRCSEQCPSFLKVRCPHLDKPPYVCNDCVSYRRCRLPKFVYRPTVAQNRATISTSRSRSAKHVDATLIR